MKRDKKLCESILKTFEENEHLSLNLQDVYNKFKETDSNTVGYQCFLLMNAGFLFEDTSTNPSRMVLTWSGHELLDQMSQSDREETKKPEETSSRKNDPVSPPDERKQEENDKKQDQKNE